MSKVEATPEDREPWLRESKVTEVALTAVRTDGGTQQRVGTLNRETVAEMKETLIDTQGGDSDIIDHPFDCIDVYYDGEDFWLADGHYRCAAYTEANIPVICAKVREGTQRDAILHSCHANSRHGTRRTNEDKRKAVATVLSDKEWRRYSTEAIAEICCVSTTMVREIRADMEAKDPEMKAEKRVSKSGREVNTAKASESGRKGAEKTNGAKAKPAEAKDDDDEKNPEDELTDAEWLEMLPIYEKLVAVQGNPVHFIDAALSWRSLSQNGFRDQMRYHLRAFKKEQDDDLCKRFLDLYRIPHPAEWGLCAHCVGSMEVHVDNDGRFIAPNDPAWNQGRSVGCACNGGYVFEGGITE